MATPPDVVFRDLSYTYYLSGNGLISCWRVGNIGLVRQLSTPLPHGMLAGDRNVSRGALT